MKENYLEVVFSIISSSVGCCDSSGDFSLCLQLLNHPVTADLAEEIAPPEIYKI